MVSAGRWALAQLLEGEVYSIVVSTRAAVMRSASASAQPAGGAVQAW